MLVKAGAASEDAVRDALKNQIIFGGRLGTNLLEIQAVTEEALAKTLGKQHALPCLFGPQRPDAGAVALLPREVADRCDAVPFALRDRRLGVVVVDPRNLAMLDEIAFVTGKSVHPIVAPEARVWALLRQSYEIDRHLRGLDVDFAHLRKLEDARKVSDAPRMVAQPVAADLMDEGEFNALYEQMPGPAATAPSAAQAAAPAAPPGPPPDDVIELTDLIEPDPWSVEPASGPTGHRGRRPRRAHSGSGPRAAREARGPAPRRAGALAALLHGGGALPRWGGRARRHREDGPQVRALQVQAGGPPHRSAGRRARLGGARG
jgi:hypothetical protein